MTSAPISSHSPRLRGAVVGAGYFSQFHFDAWDRIPDVDLVAVCDSDETRARQVAASHRIAHVYQDVSSMLEAERPDFVDLITPPAGHQALCRLAGEARAHVLCQKPLAPSLAEAREIVAAAEDAGIRFMAHDNFRFQPWHREFRRLCDAGAIGRLHSIGCRTRFGDGWGPEAYLSRQPYFRTMPQLLVHETGVHMIDVFRYIGGEIRQVFAKLRRLNPVIAGEDSGWLVCDFESGAVGIWDANRYNDSLAVDARYTFGEFLLEGESGALRLDESGRMLLQPIGQPAREHRYVHERRGFAGDSCYAAIRHFVDRLIDGGPFETDGREYLKTLAVEEAVYASAASNRPVVVSR